MKIFSPRVPSATTNRELRRLIGEVLKKRFHVPFTQWPSIGSCDVLQFQDGNGVVEYHGLVSIFPDEAGSWFITHFKQQRLHDQLLSAREFMDRKRNPERIGSESDRRRPNLQITRVLSSSPTLRDIDHFLRRHGV
ncbi:hypothetical protein [Sedimenticola selenatireducens]|uniref:hypothetical protein n=1 Tax=Sedimenticola selenatireducens TaxID=191960 RepID=UPI00048DA162|nr:hypothetical protein [Sedimenticola selenatireducens]